MRSFCVFVVLALAPYPSDQGTLNSILDVISVAKDVVVWSAKAWHLIDTRVEFSEVPLPLLERTEKKLFSKIDQISVRLNELGAQVDAIGMNTISMMLNNLPERIRLELRLNDLLTYHSQVDVYYHNMQKYLVHRDEIETATLKDFANGIISHNTDSVVHIIEKIYTYIVPTGKGITNTGILQLLGKVLKFQGLQKSQCVIAELV